MESYYPEVLEKRDFIEKIVKSEEESFARTLHSKGPRYSSGPTSVALDDSTLLSLEMKSFIWV